MEADTVDGGSLNHRCPNLHFLNSRVLVTGLQDTCSLAAILVPCSISAILLAEDVPLPGAAAVLYVLSCVCAHTPQIKVTQLRTPTYMAGSGSV